MKKCITSLLSVALILSCMSSVYASDYRETNELTMVDVDELTELSINESTVLDDGTVVTRISYSDYLNETARNNKTTVCEVQNQEEHGMINSINSNEFYYNYSKECGLDGTSTCKFRAILHATLKLWTNGANAQISNCSAVYTTASAGSYNYEWIEAASYSDPPVNDSNSFPVGVIYLFGDGQFKVTTSTSTEGSVDLEILGFSRASQTSKIWYSNTLHMRGSYQYYK